MDEEDASKLEAALTPLVHNGQEQVGCGGDEDVDDNNSDRDRFWWFCICCICIFVQGWEETTDAALTFLLRTSLAKVSLFVDHIFASRKFIGCNNYISCKWLCIVGTCDLFTNFTNQPGRENQGATPITLDAVKETSRIKKHVSSVVDRCPSVTKVIKVTNVTKVTTIVDLQDHKGWKAGGSQPDSRFLAVHRLGHSGGFIRRGRQRRSAEHWDRSWGNGSGGEGGGGGHPDGHQVTFQTKLGLRAFMGPLQDQMAPGCPARDCS